MQNLNYLFNKAYYQNLGTPAFEVDVKKANQTIEQLQFTQDNYKESPFEKNPCFQKIIMQIRYPGLIVGMGNPHGVGTKDFDWKKDIFQYVCDNDSYELVEQFTDASIALKLAFNFFDLVEDTKKYKDGKLIENSAITSVESQGDE